MALVDGQGVEGILLLELGLNELDERQKVGCVFLGLRPLLLGQQLVGDAALDGAADAEDAVVALLLGETAECGLDLGALLGDEIVGTGWERHSSAGGAKQYRRGRMSIGRMAGAGNIPETELSVARGIGVPVGERLEGTVKPGPLDNEGSQGCVGHRGCWSTGFGLWLVRCCGWEELARASIWRGSIRRR